jgi:hypothetical protein
LDRFLNLKIDPISISSQRFALALCALLAFAGLGAAQEADAPAQAESAVSKPETAEADANADLAFGAFQRGYFLTALELALPRAQVGDPAAQTLIAELYSKGLGVKLDQKEAISWYKLAAQAGDASAQFALAMYFLDGVDVEQDRERAKDLLTRSANQGNALAQFNLGQLLIAERPTAASYADALVLFEKSAASGNIDANYSAAQILIRGLDGLGPRPQLARPFLEEAAKGNIAAAQIELGILLVNGLPEQDEAQTQADQKAGFEWLRKAAFTANPVAQNRVARLRAEGIGVERDLVEAAKWHILARRAGVSDTQLDRMFARLSQDDRAQALVLANFWPDLPGRDPFAEEAPTLEIETPVIDQLEPALPPVEADGATLTDGPADRAELDDLPTNTETDVTPENGDDGQSDSKPKPKANANQ